MLIKPPRIEPLKDQESNRTSPIKLLPKEGTDLKLNSNRRNFKEQLH